ncbi:hypothetical protein ACFQ10_23030 [Streptomyces indonesiensis]
MYELTVPPVSTSAEDDAAETEKLPADEALNVIRTCWVMGETITEAARKSTRSTSYVHKVYQRLRDQGSDPQATGHDRVREAVAV